MGNSSWSNSTYSSISSSYASKTRAQVFTSKGINKDMDPKNIKVRESRDSVEHPNSIAVAVFLDETGSMGGIPEYLIKNKLGTLMNTLIKHDIVDAHVLFGGIGDQESDKAPLQVGQFEAGTVELDNWLTKIYLEANGGGQAMESYSLAWLLAARHTSIDCFEKRGEKGFLFTIGDEWVHPILHASEIKEIMGYSEAEDIRMEDILAEAQRSYHVYHLYIDTGYHLLPRWKELLGENAIEVIDKDAIAEIIASIVAVIHGAALADVVKDFDTKTASTVTNALARITKDVSKANGKGLMTL